MYRCGNLLYVLLPRIWGTVVYALLLVQRQYGSQQFIPMTSILAGVDLEYQGEDYKKSLQMAALQRRERYESGLNAYTDKTTPRYDAWWRV